MPDGGINLVLNLGEDIKSLKFSKNIKHEGTYLVGTMMQTDEQVLLGKVLLFGVKFRPGAFTHFYQFESLEKYSNQFHEFNRKEFPDIKKTIQYFLPYIDQFYLDRLSPPRYSILNIVSDICEHTGILKIDALASRHFTTVRHLERQFNQQIGVSPKEFINLTRFNNAFVKFQSNNKQTLSDIAWESGYYDHAHLTNDFKRYTGKAPTDFFLSDFSKSLSAGIL
jgi:AraC-like DNA-binding protein